MLRAVVDGVCSDDVTVVFIAPHGSVYGPMLFLLYKSDLTMILENTYVGYFNDSALLVEILYSSNIVYAISFLYRDLTLIGDSCKPKGMLLKLIYLNDLIIQKFRTRALGYPNLLL